MSSIAAQEMIGTVSITNHSKRYLRWSALETNNDHAVQSDSGKSEAISEVGRRQTATAADNPTGTTC